MIKTWQKFEENCLKYLVKTYGNIATFEQMGGSDSTVPDILVTTKKAKFFMETKMPNAQSRQFVILDDGSKFNYSDKNKDAMDSETSSILESINKNYKKYKDVDSSSIAIDIDSNIFANWIIKHYKKMNVKFVITEFQGEYVIANIDNYANYFSVAANLRRKKSGSSDLPKSHEENIIALIKKELKINNPNIVWEGKKAYLANQTLDSDTIKLSNTDNAYQLGLVSKKKCIIRKLSNTNNPNVIFSIQSKSTQNSSDLAEFEKCLKF